MSRISYIATGDANFYQLLRDQKWLAVVQFNGELHVDEQKGLLESMVLSGSDVAAMVRDREIVQFVRDCVIIPGLSQRIQPFLDPVSDAIEDPTDNDSWYMAMDLMLSAAKESGLWPVKPVPVEPVLTEQAQEDRDDFESVRDQMGGCSCHINTPCSYCTHPGNPANQEDESCWMAAP